jgi:hypothetical protein
MKKLTLVFALSFVLCASAYAQTDSGMADAQGGKQQGMMMDEGMMSMMDRMMGQGMVMGEIMRMMKGMMDMQEKTIMGVNPDDKKQMLMDMSRMKETMESMMSAMMGQSSEGSIRMDCAKEWLAKAIGLHVVHLDDPATATEPSQLEMMEQMKKAYGCLTDASIANKEANDGEPSTDPHGHR